MLTHQELERIFKWQPYRDEWVVNRNLKEDNIELYYSCFIKSLNINPHFQTFCTEAGSMTNYLEFICTPISELPYNGNAILLFISLCAPVAIYGQVVCSRAEGFSSQTYFDASTALIINDEELKPIASAIEKCLAENKVKLLPSTFLSQKLPKEILPTIDTAFSDTFLDGIFQRAD